MSVAANPRADFRLQPVVPGRTDVQRETLVVTPALQIWAVQALTRGGASAEEIPFLSLLADGRSVSALGWIDQDEWKRLEERVSAIGLDVPTPLPVVDRLLDDGRWFMTADLNCSRAGLTDLPYGFLEIRCEADWGEPQSLVAGGYEKLPNGRWAADILLNQDLDNGSTYKPLGEFTDRNSAIMAVWDHRAEARLPEGRQYGCEPAVEAAWKHANDLAATKGRVVFGALSEGQEFQGKILSVDAIYTVQSLGRSAAIHATPALSRAPSVGEVMALRYDAKGFGIAEAPALARALAR